MNIGSGNKYPANALSNFAPHPFEIDGVQCASMEGFLQSLKFKNKEMQTHICTLVGRAAKKAGSSKNQWKQKQILYWNDTEYPRESQAYADLIERAFYQLAKNDGFKRALLATNNSVLEHTIGRKKASETVLTRKEFTSILTQIRSELQSERN